MSTGTPATRFLESAKVPFRAVEYDYHPGHDRVALQAAEALGGPVVGTVERHQVDRPVESAGQRHGDVAGPPERHPLGGLPQTAGAEHGEHDQRDQVRLPRGGGRHRPTDPTPGSARSGRGSALRRVRARSGGPVGSSVVVGHAHRVTVGRFGSWAAGVGSIRTGSR